MNCPYCGNEAELVTGKEIYPYRTDLHSKQFWLCKSCDAYVGCHGYTSRPLGTMANKELRMLRKKTHDTFDPLWKGKSKRQRREMYKELAKKLGIEVTDCHIGRFGKSTCMKVVGMIEMGQLGKESK